MVSLPTKDELNWTLGLDTLLDILELPLGKSNFEQIHLCQFIDGSDAQRNNIIYCI